MEEVSVNSGFDAGVRISVLDSHANHGDHDSSENADKCYSRGLVANV
jgi:hypothetical protein